MILLTRIFFAIFLFFKKPPVFVNYFFFFSKKSPIFVNFIIYFIANPLYILYN